MYSVSEPGVGSCGAGGGPARHPIPTPLRPAAGPPFVADVVARGERVAGEPHAVPHPPRDVAFVVDPAGHRRDQRPLAISRTNTTPRRTVSPNFAAHVVAQVHLLEPAVAGKAAARRTARRET